MLGHSHAVSGAVTGAAAGEFILHLPLAGVGALAYLAAAWATVPDLDTRGSCAARSLGFFSEAADLIAIGIAVGITLAGWELALVPLACALGCGTHIAGDMLTDSGAPLLWPFVDYRFKWWPEPFAFTTGTRPETAIIVPALTIGLLFLAWHAVVLPPVIPR